MVLTHSVMTGEKTATDLRRLTNCLTPRTIGTARAQRLVPRHEKLSSPLLHDDVHSSRRSERRAMFSKKKIQGKYHCHDDGTAVRSFLLYQEKTARTFIYHWFLFSLYLKHVLLLVKFREAGLDLTTPHLQSLPYRLPQLLRQRRRTSASSA